MPENNCFENANPCSGCGACAVICPKSAISINMNKDGFYEAVLDEQKCISCGLCIKVCTKYKDSVPSTAVLDRVPLFAVWNKDKKALLQSSSGGVAWLLTKMALKEGYSAAGVIYDYSQNCSKLVFTDNIEQAESFKGSKYLQAETSNCYKQILSKPGKFIVFGAPCQIAGLDAAAKTLNRRADFLLVDCFCHGVPSYLLWDSFLKYIGIENPEKVTFRNKAEGWHNYFMLIEGNGKVFKSKVQKNPFYKLFFSDFMLNESCYKCGVKAADYSDIRLGDFWGGDYDLREDGVSAVMAISQSGREWVEKIKQSGEVYCQDGNKKTCAKAQNVFRVTHFNREKRKIMLNALKSGGITEALKTYNSFISPKRRIAASLKANLPGFVVRLLRFITHKVGAV